MMSDWMKPNVVTVFPEIYIFYSNKMMCFIITPFLSYDVTVIQWITWCHQNYMTTLVITLLREHLTSLTMSVSTMRFHIQLIFIFNGHMINRILHSWSFHTTFMKLAEGMFHKFRMK